MKERFISLLKSNGECWIKYLNEETLHFVLENNLVIELNVIGEVNGTTDLEHIDTWVNFEDVLEIK